MPSLSPSKWCSLCAYNRPIDDDRKTTSSYELEYRHVCTKHIYLSARGGSAFGSLARGLSKGIKRQWNFAYVQFFPLSTMHQLTKQHSMPYVSLVLFHPKSHCFFPLLTRTSVHQR